MKRLSSGDVVYDPRGTVTRTPLTLATRPAQLEGLRLGVLDNAKWNASRLLRAIVTRLGSRHRLAAVTVYKKDSFSRVAPDELLDQISNENDVVITAVGD